MGVFNVKLNLTLSISSLVCYLLTKVRNRCPAVKGNVIMLFFGHVYIL